jgi:hypothetical protein
MITPINKVQTNMNNTFKQEKSQYEFIEAIHAQRGHSDQLQLYSQKGNEWKFQSKVLWGSS